MLLDFTTLREWPLRGGGIGAEIVVDEGSSKEQVLMLGRFLRDVAWPKGFLNFLVYDNAAAWEARGLCDKAYDEIPTGAPTEKYDEVESGPICIKATQLAEKHLLLSGGRNPSTGYSAVGWIGP